MERFNAEGVVKLIEEFQIRVVYMAPIMMDRISKLPNLTDYDLSSITDLIHTAAPCPPWLKRFWIDRIGAEHVKEVYGATELVGLTFIRGGRVARNMSAVSVAHCQFAR